MKFIDHQIFLKGLNKSEDYELRMLNWSYVDEEMSEQYSIPFQTNKYLIFIYFI